MPQAIYRDLEFPLSTSACTMQRLMKIELERNRRQRWVRGQASMGALRFRPWEGVTVGFDRLTPFTARITGWRFTSEGGIDRTLRGGRGLGRAPNSGRIRSAAIKSATVWRLAASSTKPPI